MARGLCGNCAQTCEGVCPEGVPVAYIMERVEYVDRFYYEVCRVGDQYDALWKSVKNCPEGCNLCEEACLHGLLVRERLAGAEKRFRNARERVINIEQ